MLLLLTSLILLNTTNSVLGNVIKLWAYISGNYFVCVTGVQTSEKLGVKGLPPQKLINFDLFVNCIVIILVYFSLFCYFFLIFCQAFQICWVFILVCTCTPHPPAYVPAELEIYCCKDSPEQCYENPSRFSQNMLLCIQTELRKIKRFS